MIVNAGVQRVVAKQDYHAADRSKDILRAAGIKLDILEDAIVKY
jgi:deoxycytidylate deaminase